MTHRDVRSEQRIRKCGSTAIENRKDQFSQNEHPRLNQKTVIESAEKNHYFIYVIDISTHLKMKLRKTPTDVANKKKARYLGEKSLRPWSQIIAAKAT